MSVAPESVMFRQGGPRWQIHALSELFVFHDPEALRASFRPHVGRGAPLPPLHHCQSPCRPGRSRVRLQGLSDCPAGPALARVFPWVPWSLVPVGVLHGLGWHLPLWGTFSATPSCSSKRASWGVSVWSQGKSSTPTPPPSKSWGFGGPEAAAAMASHVELHL